MGLKSIIKRQKILNAHANDEMTLPGEPLIYSIKFQVGRRAMPLNFFRDLKWRSMLKCQFPFYYKSHTPVVVLVKFFVSPPSYIDVSAKQLKSEKVPAVHSFEVADYGLSFLEMLQKVLFNCYRQVVKIDIEKFYSANPRTVFKYMNWTTYVNLQSKHSRDAKAQTIDTPRKRACVQPECQRNGSNPETSQESARATEVPPVFGSTLSNREVLPTSPAQPKGIQAPGYGQIPAHKKARRGQSRKIPE